MEWMIYGANGYTGKLIAERAVEMGLKPLLGGRGDAVRLLAAALGLSARVFDITASTEHLDGISLVLNCAGPFSATTEPMIAACLAAKVHYLDITGEIDVLELAARHDLAARDAGVVLCPGVGFDVVPTDCVAAALSEALPDATHLSLGFDTDSPMSPGTAKTVIEGFGHGGKARRDGGIVTTGLAARIRRIDFGRGHKTTMSIPWGDVSTAWHSTGIPNVEVFLPTPALVAVVARVLSAPLRWIFSNASVQRWSKLVITHKVRGPDREHRKRLRTLVWGEARNAHGERRVARLETPNAYDVTVEAAIAVVRYVIEHAPSSGGYFTPSRLCGWRLIETLPGCGHIIVERA